MKKYRWMIAILLILLIGAGIWAGKQYLQNRNFTRVHPSEGEITEAIYGLGKVKSNQRFEVKIGILSPIRKVFVNEGDSVKKNQKLIEFDSNVVIYSPIAGTVTLVAAYEGETALPQVPVIRVEDLHDRYIELSLEQEAILRIKKDQTALVSFESLRNKLLKGKITTIFPKENEFIAEVTVADLDDNILPGMTADVSVEVGKIKGLLIPAKAVRNSFVSVARGRRIEKVKVEVGLSDSLSVEIKGDTLKPEDEILVPKE